MNYNLILDLFISTYYFQNFLALFVKFLRHRAFKIFGKIYFRNLNKIEKKNVKKFHGLNFNNVFLV
jgi:hypothetical protein